MSANPLSFRKPRQTGKRIFRDVVLPRGSRRDHLWTTWIRPKVNTVLGRPQPEPPVSTLTEWTSPRATIKKVDTILVLKVDHLGDFFLALPAFAMLRRSFPDARIALLCASWNEAMARSTGFFDTIHVFDHFISHGDSTLRYRGDPTLIRKLGLPVYDLAIDLRVNEDTRVLLRHVDAKCKVGYASDTMPDDMALVLPQPAWRQPDTAGVASHQRGLNIALVSAAVSLLDPFGDTGAAFARITESEDIKANRLLSRLRTRPGPLVAVNTGSGREIKNWPIGNFVSLCRWVTTDLEGTVVLLGTANQTKDAAFIVNAVGTGVVDLVGQCPMERSLAIVRGVDLFLGNDSSLTHASSMMETPTVAVYSGIDPISVWGPLGPHVTAIRASVPCSPCSLSYISECSQGHACMRGIPVEKVQAAMQRALGLDKDAVSLARSGRR